MIEGTVFYATATVLVFSNPGQTTLGSDIGAQDDVIAVASVANTRQVGTIKINDEVVEYSGVDAQNNQFTGCIRGQEGTAAASHQSGAVVHFSTTTPCVSRARVMRDLRVVDERYAQATIRLKRPVPINMGGQGDPGVPLPGAFMDGKYDPIDPPIGHPEPNEIAIVAYKDADPDSIDSFYVPSIAGWTKGGIAYIELFNGTDDLQYQNFVVLSPTLFPGPPTQVDSELILAHEYMHILLNDEHRFNDPDEALFKANGIVPGTPIYGRKRIGPFPTAAVGMGDTITIRNRVGNLP